MLYFLGCGNVVAVSWGDSLEQIEQRMMKFFKGRKKIDHF